MKLQIVERAKGLLFSYWFIPVLCSLGALALAIIADWLDTLAAGGQLPPLPFFRQATQSGTRAILSTIAGSSISVAGVVFSISMLVLSTTASQFGPRLLPMFFRRNSTQLVLGGFIATFVTALLMLVQVTETGSRAGLHSYALGLSLALALLSVALLVYFLQSVASFIQVPRIIDDVARDLAETLTRETVSAETGGTEQSGDGEDFAARFGADALEISAKRGGYVQALDIGRALSIAAEGDLCLWMQHRPGQYVGAGEALVRARPAGRVDGETERALRALFVVGEQRNNSQDVEFAADQLVEIALRALSPGINDPFTAINCIDRLGDALAILSRRRFPPDVRRDEAGKARVLTVGFTDGGILDAVFNPLRQHGCQDVAVSIRLIEVIASIGRRAPRDGVRQGLRNHLERIRDACRREIPGADDLGEIEARYRGAAKVLAYPPTAEAS